VNPRFTATYRGQSFEVEITRDGEMVFCDPDTEYEIAFAAMGGDKTPAVKLLDLWRDSPIDGIFKCLGLDKNTMVLLAADWAEHVLPIFERKYNKDKRPRKSIKAVRDFVAGKIGADDLHEACDAAWAAAEAAAKAAAVAALAAAAVAEAAAVAAVAAVAAEAAADAADAAAYDRSEDHISPEWQQAYDAERAWQVRRFVDVMTALRAGKKWPRMAR
jgi:hypothetical protein